jgi:glycosyltransferase involved in cell wall biosynthesis
MRILVLSESLPTDEAPASGRFIWRHTLALSRWAHVTPVHLVITRSWWPTVHMSQRVTEGRPVTELRASGPPVLAEVAASFAVGRMLRSADVLHSMAMESLITAACTRRRGRAWVHTEHSSNVTDPPGGSIGFIVRVLRLLLRRPVLVTCVSDFLATGVTAIGRTRPTKVVPNVVAVPRLQPFGSPESGGESRSEETLIVSVGALVPSKRPLLALETVAELRRRGLHVRLLWIGEGPLAADFDRALDAMYLRSHVQRRGFLAPEEYLTVLRSASVFLLPTAFETFCVSAAEAVACGLPVVLGERGGQSEFVNESNGVLVASVEPSAYADAVVQILSASEPIPTAAAIGTIRTRFSEATTAERFADAYRSVGLDPTVT